MGTAVGEGLQRRCKYFVRSKYKDADDQLSKLVGNDPVHAVDYSTSTCHPSGSEECFVEHSGLRLD